MHAITEPSGATILYSLYRAALGGGWVGRGLAFARPHMVRCAFVRGQKWARYRGTTCIGSMSLLVPIELDQIAVRAGMSKTTRH